jgi:hypothetical protein
VLVQVLVQHPAKRRLNVCFRSGAANSTLCICKEQIIQGPPGQTE